MVSSRFSPGVTSGSGTRLVSRKSSKMSTSGTSTNVLDTSVPRKRLSLPQLFDESSSYIRAQLNALLREPGLPSLVEHDYGYEWLWSRDVFTLFHNAIRRELQDCHNVILTAMRKAEFDMEERALLDFKLWWETFKIFVKVYVNIQKYVLVPRLLRAEPADFEGSMAMEKYSGVWSEWSSTVSCLDKVSSALENFTKVYDVQTLSEFMMAIDATTHSLARIMNVEAIELGELMEKFFCPEDMSEIEHEMVVAVLESQNGSIGLIILTQWMNHHRVVFEDWQERHGISSTEYNQYLEEFMLKHRSIVNKFLMLKRANQKRLDQSSIHPIRLPVLCVVDYGFPWSWSLDPLSLPHNAIRRELMDMYTIMLSIRTRNYEVSPIEVHEFSQWFAVFRTFFLEYTQVVEEKVLFPFVSSFDCTRADVNSDHETAALNWKHIDALKSTVLGHLSDIWNFFAEILESLRVSRLWLDQKLVPQTIRKGLRSLLVKLEAWVPLVVQYFVLQETSIAPILEASADSKSCKRIVQEVVESFVKSSAMTQNVIILCHWISDEDQLRKWLDEFITTSRSMQFAVWRSRFEKKHRGVVHRFHEKRTEALLVSHRSRRERIFDEKSTLGYPPQRSKSVSNLWRRRKSKSTVESSLVESDDHLLSKNTEGIVEVISETGHESSMNSIIPSNSNSKLPGLLMDRAPTSSIHSSPQKEQENLRYMNSSPIPTNPNNQILLFDFEYDT